MLQTIGKHIQGWIAWVVIALIAATFVFWGLEYYITRSGNQQTAVATVNGVKITQKQLNNTYEALQRSYTQQGGVLDEQGQQQLQGMALQQIMLDQVLLQTAKQMGFAISMEEIQQEILRVPGFQEQGQFSPQKFQQLLSNNNVTPEEFFTNVQGSLLVNQLSTGIQNSSFITQAELAQTYGMLQQQRSFGYFTLPSAPFAAAAQPTEAQINAYYQQHTNQFLTPEQVKVAYILLSPDNIKSQVKVSPEDVQQFYQDNANEFKGKSLAEVKDNIQQRLYQQQLNQALSAKSDQLQDLTYTNPSSLDNAAKTLGLPIQTSAWLSRQGIKGDTLFGDPKVLAIIFSDEVLKQNNNSQLIELKDGSSLVVRIADRQASQTQPLAAVHDQIKQLLQKEQGQKQAGLLAYQIQHALEAGTEPEALAKSNHLEWVTKNNISLQDKTLPGQLLSAVFNLAPNADPAKKAVTSVILANGDYAIIQLESFHNPELAQASTADLEKLRADLADRWGELDYQLFAKSALDKAKIKKF